MRREASDGAKIVEGPVQAEAAVPRSQRVKEPPWLARGSRDGTRSEGGVLCERRTSVLGVLVESTV